MNHIYKLVWNRARNMYMAVSEMAKSHGKSGSASHAGRKAALLAAAALMASGMFGMAEAADNDAVNVAQLKAISNTVDASKTKYYSVNDSAPGAIFDNEEFEKHYTNKNNDGAKSYYAMAAGYGTYAAGDASTVIGSYSVIQNDKVKDGDDEDLSPQGATAVSVGSFNFNLNTPIKSSNDFSKWYSGTANSIVGQGNLTKDSNGVLIYGAGNKITNSYRGDVPINMLAASMNSDVYQNPESFTDKVGEAVLQSGGQVMAIGGGNVADKAYMTQLMGVGNKVQGADITFTPPELQDDEENYERYITAFNSAFNKQATRLNYVDGFYNNLTNAKNDYVIGMANDISGDDVSSNKSNIVIGDFHQMKNGSNNIILGSQDGKLTQKRYNTDGTLGTKESVESVNRFTHQEKLADAVMIGHNADVLKNGGVALGADSVASVDKDVVGYDPSGTDHNGDTTGIWKSKAAAVSVGNKNFTRQITNVAAGTQDTDAVNVAQLKAVSTASKTKYYSVRNIPYIADQLGTYAAYTNEKNDGAKEMGALAAGYLTYAGGIASTVTGSLSGVINQAAAPGSQDFRGATALSYGTFNINNNTAQSGLFSGVANSIVGQANMTTDSNAALIYGAGNVISNSYRKIDITKMGAITGNLTDPKALGEALQAAVPTSGGQVMAFGGGNVVDNAYMTQVMGVGNTVKGNQKKNNDGTWTSKDNTEFNDDTSSQLNYVDGFYTTLINGKSDYLIGAHNTVTGDSVEKNHSNIVIGDNHTLENQSNNIILGSADSTLPTTASQVTIVGHNANATVEGGVAIGSGSVASVDKGVEGYKPNSSVDTSTDPAGTWKSTDAAVSVGKADGSMTRQITGVAAGTKATDAVNVAQLQNALSGAKDGNDTLKSGTDALKLDGNTLSMSVEDTAGHKVSGSVDLSKFAQAVDTNTTYTLTGQANQDNTTTITLEDNNGKKNSVTVATKDTRNTVKAGENVTLDTKDNADGSHEYTVHVKADGKVEAGSTKIVSGGTVYNETRVQKDGTYVKASNTAGENLTALDSQVASNAGAVNELNGRVNRLDSRINKVGAGAAALAALHPLDFNPDDKWDFAVGYGNYRNANSVALGAFYRPNENTMLSLGTNFGNGENMFNAGVSFKIGKGNSYAGYSKVEMAKVIDTQSREVAALKEENAKNAKDNAVMKAEIEALKKQVEALAAKK